MSGTKQMKTPRGSARRIRRAGLVRGWRNIKGAKQMVPSALQLAADANQQN